MVERLRICRGGGGEERSPVVEEAEPAAVASPLSKESRPGGEPVDWLPLLTMTFLSGSLGRQMGGVKGTSCGSESVSGLAAMWLELLSLGGQGGAASEWEETAGQDQKYLIYTFNVKNRHNLKSVITGHLVTYLKKTLYSPFLNHLVCN